MNDLPQKNLNFPIGNFLQYIKHAVITIYEELRESPMSKFYESSVDRRDLMSIRSKQMIKKSNDWISLNINKNHCHGNSTHLSQNAKSSVVNLNSCKKKRAPKHKWLKSNGGLGIGS